MAGSWIRLMIVVLCFSCLVCKNGAIPATRSSNLLRKPQGSQIATRVLVENPNNKMWKMETTRRRLMEIEMNDYPGSGANNRHTPRPQLGRGCIDC